MIMNAIDNTSTTWLTPLAFTRSPAIVTMADETFCTWSHKLGVCQYDSSTLIMTSADFARVERYASTRSQVSDSVRIASSAPATMKDAPPVDHASATPPA